MLRRDAGQRRRVGQFLVRRGNLAWLPWDTRVLITPRRDVRHRPQMGHFLVRRDDRARPPWDTHVLITLRRDA